MENVSKALLMAGGMMFTILVVTILLYSINIYSENQKEKMRMEATQELTKFNLQFTNYARDDIMGYELISLVNKVIDYNQRFSSEGESTSSKAGNYFQYTPITVKIDFKSDGGTHDNLYDQLHTRTEMNRPAVARDGYKNEKYEYIYNNLTKAKYTENMNKFTLNSSDYLFKNNNYPYTQSNTVNQFGTILDRIYQIEEQYTKDGAQNLAKSIGSIFEGKIIGYNGQPPDDLNEKKQWYEQSYIEARFKSLTNLNYKIGDKNNGIRSDDVAKDILQYNEYMQFKKASFECYNVEYDNISNRISKMEFRYTGDDLE